MSGIVCAIRGGPDSQPTISQAIALAQKTGQTIYFLYVVNLDFLSHTSTSRTRVVQQEMQEMGAFILSTAQAEALDKGATAEIVIRQGQVRKEIIEQCHAINASYVVLGLPRGKTEADIFTHERLKQFTQYIEQESHAKVILAQVKSQ